MEHTPFFNIGKILIPGAGAATNFQGAQAVFERAKANVCHTLVTLYVSLNRREEEEEEETEELVGWRRETQAPVHEREHEHVTNTSHKPHPPNEHTITYTHNQHEARGAG